MASVLKSVLRCAPKLGAKQGEAIAHQNFEARQAQKSAPEALVGRALSLSAGDVRFILKSP